MNKYFQDYKRYLSIFKISIQQEFAYRLNFIMWRIRNVMQILVFFFLWNAVFETNPGTHFGYTKEKILTYAFLLIITRAIVLSSRSVDVANQIASGEISNFLVKPINFFKYWLLRDASSKALNIAFSIIEINLLIILIRPNIFYQTNILNLVLFVLSLAVAGFLYFTILMLTNFVTFWLPQVSWGAQFLMLVIVVEFLSGSYFPLDVFSSGFYSVLRLTPFPYLIFFPIRTYLGIDSVYEITKGIAISLSWCVVLWSFMKRTWFKGLKQYESVGR